MDSTPSTKSSLKAGTKSRASPDRKFPDDMKYLPGDEGVCGWTMALVQNNASDYLRDSPMSLHSINKSTTEEKISMMRPRITRPSSPSEVNPFGPDYIRDPRESARKKFRRIGSERKARMQSSIKAESTFSDRGRYFSLEES